jgi:hypothetical protein
MRRLAKTLVSEIYPTDKIAPSRSAAFHDLRCLTGYRVWLKSSRFDVPDNGTAQSLGTSFGRGLEGSWTVPD